MTFTTNDFSDAIEKYLEDNDEYFNELGDDWKDEGYETPLGLVKVVTSWGGEGEGEYCGFVLEHVDSGRQFLITGYYQSYDGVEYSSHDFTEVEQVKVEVLRFKDTNSKKVFKYPVL